MSYRDTPRLSVVIPTHNPRADYLQQVLAALRRQTLPVSEWELLVVDNQSDPPLQNRVDLAWHSSSEVVREERLGLTHARVAGFAKSRGDVIVLVDDDNVLAVDYLERALEISVAFPFVAVWGGGIQPQYEDPDAAPPESLRSLLTLRNVAADLWSNDPDHHDSTPWGAGLCLRRAIAERHLGELSANPRRYDLDLKGTVLLYGGDTDIAYTACRMGQAKGVFRRLSVAHLIPSARCSDEYLCRVSFGRGYSGILHYLSLHGELPQEDSSPSQWIRTQYRRLRLGALERAVDRAHMRGRAEAFRDLARKQ